MLFPKLIIGLGNPEKVYENTRHNLGFLLADYIARKHISSWKRFYKVAKVSVISDLSDVILFKPMTYMNNSGLAVKKALKDYGIKPCKILVAVDDFSLPLGSLRFRLKGSSGGHNGISSIIDNLGTNEFPRLRMGIGPVPERADTSDFVLSDFVASERKCVKSMIEEASLKIEDMINSGWEKAISAGKR